MNIADMNQYYVCTYRGQYERTEVVTATSADATLPHGPFASQTRRWQRSPVEADRDNIHVQFDLAGHNGVAVWRADINPREAEHRNDVAVARAWVADGYALADLQKYGGYSSVTSADVQTAR